MIKRRNRVKFKSKLVNGFLLLTSISAVLGISEFIVRQLPVSHRLGCVATPSVQERFDKFKKGTNKVIVILGDSFAVWHTGTGRNMFDYVKNDLLREDYTVLNLASPGADVNGYISTYEKFVSFKPDCIIMCLYLGDDVYIYETPNRVRKVDPYYLKAQEFKRLLKRHSILLNLIFRVLKQKISFLRSDFFERIIEQLQEDYQVSDAYIESRIGLIDQDVLEKAKSDVINPYILANGVIVPDHYKTGFGMESEASHLAVKSTVELIHKLYTESQVNKFFVVLLPESLQVSKSYDDFYLKCGFNLNNFPLEKRRKIIEDLKIKFNKIGINVIDLIPGLAKESKASVYFSDDIHLNTLGHKIAGNTIINAIQDALKMGDRTTSALNHT